MAMLVIYVLTEYDEQPYARRVGSSYFKTREGAMRAMRKAVPVGVVVPSASNDWFEVHGVEAGHQYSIVSVAPGD